MIQSNVSLKPYNTFGIAARARYFATFGSLNGLNEILANGYLFGNKPPLVLGGGSNILFTKNFEGLVLKNEMAGIETVGEDDAFVYLKAAAGENWHRFVLHCIGKNLSGVENLSLIPGCVGASPMQNIGAYGVEVKDVFHELEAYHIQEKTIVRLNFGDCRFGYRESIFKNDYKGQFIILNVTFRLNKKIHFHTGYGAINQELEKMGIGEPTLRAVSQAIINIRKSKLPNPVQIGNAGSFFKNPIIPTQKFLALKKEFPEIIGYAGNANTGEGTNAAANGSTKLAAGWLIEQCGWKGFKNGDAGVHDKQALVLVNHGNADGGEIYALSQQIALSVSKKFEVQLETEVNII